MRSKKKQFREDYMKCMDSFVKGGTSTLSSYCEKVSSIPKAADKSTIYRLGYEPVVSCPWMVKLGKAAKTDFSKAVFSLTNTDIAQLYKLMYKLQTTACLEQTAFLSHDVSCNYIYLPIYLSLCIHSHFSSLSLTHLSLYTGR